MSTFPPHIQGSDHARGAQSPSPTLGSRRGRGMAVLSPKCWHKHYPQQDTRPHGSARLGLDGRKRVLGQIHPKAPSDASVVNVPLLYIFEFSILWHVAMSCWEARNNIIPRTVNTPILSPLSHMPASGRVLCLPGLSQCREASPFLLRFPEQPAKGLPLRNSTPGKFLPIRSEESHSRG